MTKQIRTRIGLAAASVLCVVSLALPCLYGEWSNQWIQTQGSRRAAMPGTLSEAGQEIPLVYALYRNRFLEGTALEVASDATQTIQKLQAKTNALREAGALPRQAAQRAQWILRQSTAEASCKTENGFVSATYWVPDDGNGNGGMVQATWQEETELVTFYAVTISTEPAELGASLSAYRTYLGVDSLGDWTETTALENGVCSWSQAGQLYLYGKWEGDMLLMGASSREMATGKELL